MVDLSGIMSVVTEQAETILPSFGGFSLGSAGVVLGIFALPLLSMFVFPTLRVGGAVTHGVSAILSALALCVSSWITLIIQYVAALAVAMRPRPEYIPYLRFLVLGGGGVLALSWFGKSIFLFTYWILGIGVVGILYAVLNRMGRQPAYEFKGRHRAGPQPLVLVWWLTGAVALACITLLLFARTSDISECLEGRTLNEKCLRGMQAEVF